MPEGIRRRMLERLKALAADPFGRQPSVERLQGAKDTFRLRVGDWRAVYVVNREGESVEIDRIRHRREVYR
ncbi:MAG: type II toxin-antitoxin system RelE/ParE family toxin [Proteobacteria bacterium]|nr:type II toxin-antitoxin system RelE/ParE family toxin [Pseudomonadota bacterium]